MSTPGLGRWCKIDPRQVLHYHHLDIRKAEVQRIYQTSKAGLSFRCTKRGQGFNMHDIDQVHSFWFEESSEKQWFGKDPEFDRQIRERFGALVEAASQGKLEDWLDTPRGALAYILLLDQFTRNIHRGSGKAFAADAKARAAAIKALVDGYDQKIPDREKTFLYLPFEHSEELEDQERCVALFEAIGNDQLTDYAVRHRDIIARFGRFPHRNDVLGRESTDAEQEFLKQPGSSF